MTPDLLNRRGPTVKPSLGAGAGRRPETRRFLFGLALAMALRARAAVWEDPSWVLGARLDEKLEYDSNVFAIHNGPGDTFSSLTPTLDVANKDSLTGIDLQGWVNWTAFRSQTGNDSFDPGVRLTVAFPLNVPELQTEDAEFHWIRSSDTNVDVGARVSQEDALARYEGDLAGTGKTTLVGRADLDRDAYLGSGYSTNETAGLGASLLYSPFDLLRVGAGLDGVLGRSEPNSPGLDSVREWESAFAVQAEGQFTPKLTGKASLGEAYVSYRGAFVHDSWDLLAKAAVTWQPREETAVEFKVERAPLFSPIGDVDLMTSVSAQVRETLATGWTATAGVSLGRTAHNRSTTFRTDSVEAASAGLSYTLGSRFVASVTLGRIHQDSDVLLYTYRSTTVTGEVSYSF